ncbi:MAG: dihydrolipoyl dehydrogenase [Acidimicrobiales bacterium]|nr:dihydrolipoyl dehydrogenase [Acidimicrobiales bacterium]
MVVGEVADRAEAVVVGGGPGGYEAALQLAKHGKRVVLIEREAIGGVCLNVGCIPSKALIHQADIAHSSVSESATGVVVSVDLDPPQMLQHRERVVAGLTEGVRRLLSDAGVERWAGSARFARADRLVVEHSGNVRHLEFENCVLAVGGRPIVLPGFEPGRSGEVEVLDSTGALALDRIPESMVVIGGGYIGVELGTAFAKLGSGVTIVEMAGSLLPGMDPALGRVVARRLAGLGVRVELNSRALGLTNEGVTLAGGDGEVALSVDCAIVAVGRKPNTDQLNLAAAGLETAAAGLIAVGPDRKAAPRIYAVGDITDGPALAHKATAEAQVVADAIAGLPAAFDPACIPEVVFSDPEVASVGLSPAAAKEIDPGSRSARIPFSANGRAQTLANASGFAQLVVDGAGTVVGAQLAGPTVSELVGELGFAIEMAATATDLASTIHPHPTLSEALMEAAKALSGPPT